MQVWAAHCRAPMTFCLLVSRTGGVGATELREKIGIGVLSKVQEGLKAKVEVNSETCLCSQQRQWTKNLVPERPMIQ